MSSVSNSIDVIAQSQPPTDAQSAPLVARGFVGLELKRFLTWEYFAATVRHKWLRGFDLNRDLGVSGAMLDFGDNEELSRLFRLDYSNGSYGNVNDLCTLYCGNKCYGTKQDEHGQYLCQITPLERWVALKKWFDPPVRPRP